MVCNDGHARQCTFLCCGQTLQGCRAMSWLPFLPQTCQMAGIDDEPPKGVAGAIWNDVCLPWFDAFKVSPAAAPPACVPAWHHTLSPPRLASFSGPCMYDHKYWLSMCFTLLTCSSPGVYVVCFHLVQSLPPPHPAGMQHRAGD